MPMETNSADLLSSYDTFLFDADGVLWLGDGAVEGAVTAVNRLIDAGKRVIVITNNSTKTIAQYTAKTKKLGFERLNESNIVSAAVVAIDCIGKHPKKDELPVYMIGTSSLAEMFETVGIKSIGVGADPVEKYSNGIFVEDVDISQKVFAVVTSFDSQFNYVKLMKAVNYLKDPNVEFFATNEDLTFPGPVPGVIVPGAGWTSTMIREISGRQPVVMGKPHSQMFNYIRNRYSIDPQRTLMVGDRCDTDILFGRQNGIDTLMVLTGVHQLSDLAKFEKEGRTELLPKYVAPSIRVFLDS